MKEEKKKLIIFRFKEMPPNNIKKQMVDKLNSQLKPNGYFPIVLFGDNCEVLNIEDVIVDFDVDDLTEMLREWKLKKLGL